MPGEWSANEVESLIKLSSLINSSLDIIEVLDNSMRVVEELMDAEASSIFEIDFEKNDLFFRLARGEFGDKMKEVRMRMGEGVAGYVASSGESLLVPDTKVDDHFCKRVDQKTSFNTRSIIALPIKNQGRTIGVLEVLNKRGPATFDSKDLELLIIVASQIGIAIENAKLYARLKEKFKLTQTELKKIQAELIRSERLAALGELSKGVAHTMRNPVMSIGGFTRRMRKKLAPGDPAAEYTDLILEETSRLEKIVEDVGKYTSMAEPQLRQVKLSSLINRVLDEWNEKPGRDNIKIEVKMLPEDPLIFIDIELMTNALINLLLNAGEAMQGKGGTILIVAWWEEKWMVISVNDDGNGIDTKNLPFVFDPFFTTKTYGSGLGLTTVNRIVSGHCGKVKIFSTSGDGTDIRIYFPPFS
ncbi:MAG: GAF domain-containing protein [Nitrospirota bacterium]